MIPMIDLLMVTISFLLITAVWTHMARINADAQVPGPPRPDQESEKIEPEKQLHVEMRAPDKFVAHLEAGAARSSARSTFPRKDDIKDDRAEKLVRYPDLAAKIEVRVEEHGLAPRPDGQEVRPGHPAHGQRDAVRRT